MNTRDMMNSTAMDTVFGNLGMDREQMAADGMDLGGGDDFSDPGDDLGGDSGRSDVGADDFAGADDGVDDDPFAIDDGFDLQERVSHTPQDRQQQRQQPRQRQQEQRLRPDAKGNLLDAAGKVVVRAGSERRYYDGMQKARKDMGIQEAKLRHTAGRLNSITTIAQRLKSENDTFKAQQKALTDLGMSQDDQIQAMSLYRQMMKNPKDTLTRLLTRAAANGITVDGINSQQQQNVPGQIADVVKELLDGKLKPIQDFVASQQTQQTRQQEDFQLRQQTQREVSYWFDTNPDARPYAQAILRVLRSPAAQGMSLDHVWDRIQLNLARNPPQRGRQRPNGRQQNGLTPRRGSPPIGRRAAPSGTSSMAPVNASWDSILNDVMDAHGVQ